MPRVIDPVPTNDRPCAHECSRYPGAMRELSGGQRGLGFAMMMSCPRLFRWYGSGPRHRQDSKLVPQD